MVEGAQVSQVKFLQYFPVFVKKNLFTFLCEGGRLGRGDDGEEGEGQDGRGRNQVESQDGNKFGNIILSLCFLASKVIG